MASRSIAAPRKATNVSLDAKAVADARELGINISQACERGLVAEIKSARAAKWQRDNLEAIESFNAYVEKHGIPLARYRQF